MSEDDYPTALYDTLQWIDLDSSGNIMGAGQSSGNWTALKWDSDGNLLWARQFDGVYGGENLVWHMVVGPDDAIYIAGKNGVGWIMAVKCDTFGNLRWHVLFTYGNPFGAWATSIGLDAGNNVVLGVFSEVMFHYLQSDCTLGAPPEVSGVSLDPSKVSWTPGNNGEQYDLARGELGVLKNGGLLDCMVTETANPFYEARDTPRRGECFTYMVRPSSVCGVGSWGMGTNGQERGSVCP